MTGPDYAVEFFHGYTYSGPSAGDRGRPRGARRLPRGRPVRAREEDGAGVRGSAAFAEGLPSRDRHPQCRPHGRGGARAPRGPADAARHGRVPPLLRRRRAGAHHRRHHRADAAADRVRKRDRADRRHARAPRSRPWTEGRHAAAGPQSRRARRDSALDRRPRRAGGGRHGEVFNPATGQRDGPCAAGRRHAGGRGRRRGPGGVSRLARHAGHPARAGHVPVQGARSSSTAPSSRGSSPPSTARRWPTPTAPCSAAWRSSSSPAAFRTC